MVLIPRIEITAELETPIVESIQYNVVFDESYSSKSKVIFVKQGDHGIRVNVKHNADTTVYYRVDSSVETLLSNNRYFTLSASNTATIGDHVVTFIAKNENTRVTSPVTFKYSVYCAVNATPIQLFDRLSPSSLSSFVHEIHFDNNYKSTDQNIKIKQGDYNIRVKIKQATPRDLYYCIDDGPEMPPVRDGYFIINSSNTSSIGNHTVRFIEKNNTFYGVSMKSTRMTPFLYTVY